MGNPEVKSPGEDYADWKAPETGKKDESSIDYSADQDKADGNEDTRVAPAGVEQSSKGTPLLRDENGRAYSVNWTKEGPKTTMLPEHDKQVDANESSRVAPAGVEQPSKGVESVAPIAEPATKLESINFGNGILLSDPRITPNLLNQARERILNHRSANLRALEADKGNVSIQLTIDSFDRDLDIIDQWIKLKEGKA